MLSGFRLYKSVAAERGGGGAGGSRAPPNNDIGGAQPLLNNNRYSTIVIPYPRDCSRIPLPFACAHAFI